MAFRPSFVAIPLSLLMIGAGMVLVFRVQHPSSAVLEDPPIHPVTAQMLADASRKSLKPAPMFTTVDDAGKPVVLKDLVAQKPVLILFVKEGCPCSIEAQPVFNKLAAAYGASAEFLGVINGDARIAKEFSKTNEMAFPLIPDPTKSIIKQYGAERSVYVALIALDGKIDKFWPGYNQTMLGEMNDRLAFLSGVRPKQVDFRLAPTKMTSGCSFSD